MHVTMAGHSETGTSTLIEPQFLRLQPWHWVSDNINRIVPILPWSDRCESCHGGISKHEDAELLRNRGVTWVSFMLFEEGNRDTDAG